jgi:hypothetical protein
MQQRITKKWLRDIFENVVDVHAQYFSVLEYDSKKHQLEEKFFMVNHFYWRIGEYEKQWRNTGGTTAYVLTKPNGRIIQTNFGCKERGPVIHMKIVCKNKRFYLGKNRELEMKLKKSYGVGKVQEWHMVCKKAMVEALTN